MQQFGRSGARGAALRGNGWRASEAFSVAGILQRGRSNKREAMLKTAIRRMRMEKESDGTGDGRL
jgi:hypothetical protein